MEASAILKNKTAEEILEPKGQFFVFNQQRYTVKPMPDSLLMTLAEELSKITALFDSTSMALAGIDKKEAMRHMLPVIPEIIRILIPNASRIIAACIGLDHAIVSEQFSIAKKLECLHLIVVEEDLPAIVANFEKLVGAFSLATPAEPTEG